MKRKDLYNYIKEEIVNTLSEESVAWSSSTKSTAKQQIDKSKLSGDAKKQAKDEIDQNASGLISNVSESDLDEARKAGGYRIGDAGKFAEAKELYSKGLYADVLNAIEAAGEDGISQKDLGVKLGKSDSTSLNPILVKFKEIGVFGGGKLAKAEKPEAGEIDDSAPEEFDSFYATDIEDETPEEEPTSVASDKEIARLAGDVSTGKTEEINKAINIVKNLSTKIQDMKKGSDREKKIAALKQYINNNKNLLKGRDINTLTNGLIG